MDNIRIKGFDKDLKCRGFQFEVGKEYRINSTELALCTDKVFHYCKSLKQVADYYNVGGENRFCYIEVLGDEICDDEKCGSNHIKIVKEIVGAELDLMLGKINGNTGYFNSGSRNTGHMNTGNCNTGYMNTGNCNTGSDNTGNCNSGHGNTGDFNTGCDNTGYWNSGNGNTGNGNIGNGNAGNDNAGNFNSGDFNSGDFNSGDFNSGKYSSGFFCSKEPKAVIFDTETDMTVSEFKNGIYYKALLSAPFVLAERIEGKLIQYSYKEACKKWWKEMTPENKEIIKSMPNFNAEVFKEITGITIRNKKEEEK